MSFATIGRYLIAVAVVVALSIGAFVPASAQSDTPTPAEVYALILNGQMGAASIDGCTNAVEKVVSFASPGEMKVQYAKCAVGSGTLYISYSDAGMGGWDITQPIDLKKVAGKTVGYPVPSGREWALFYIEGPNKEQLAWFYHVEPLNPPAVSPDKGFSVISVDDQSIFLQVNNVPGAVYDLRVAAHFVGRSDAIETVEDIDMAKLSHDRVFGKILVRATGGGGYFQVTSYTVEWFDQNGTRMGGFEAAPFVPWWEQPFHLFASTVLNGGGVTASEVDGD